MRQEISWPGWEVVKKIGTGSFGSVYEIQRNILGDVEKAALKVITIPQNPSETEELRLVGYDDASITAHFRRYLENIVREYSLMNKLKGNTNIVYCDDIRYIRSDNGIGWTIYIKMELLTPLMKSLQSVNTEAQIVQLGQDLCKALELCRKQNIIHRDVKPQNIFVSDNGNFKLGDFGIAKTLECTAGGTRIGTYKYMVPEIYNGKPYGHSSDIYSLGLVMYWLLNEKRTPFLPLPPQLPTAFMEDEALARRFHGETIPEPLHGCPELKRIVLKACAFDPQERYASAGEMLVDLKTLKLSGISVVVEAPSTESADDPTEKIDEQRLVDINQTAIILNPDTFHAAEDDPTEYMPDERTEYIQNEKTEYIPQKNTASMVPPVQPISGKKKLWLLLVVLIAVVTAIILLLMMKSCDRGAGNPNVGFTQNNGKNSNHTAAPDIKLPAATEPQATYPVVTKPTEPEATVSEQFSVPDVVGMTRSDAVVTMESSGFIVSIAEEYSDEVLSGRVIRQAPQAESSHIRGTTVTVVISKDPKSTEDAPETTTSSESEPSEPVVLKLDLTDFTIYTKGERWSVYSGDLNPQKITWSSSNEAVATVSNGIVTAVGPGRTQIHAEYEGQKVSCWVSCNFSAEKPDETYTLMINGRVYPYGEEMMADVTVCVGQSFRLTVENSSGTTMQMEWAMSETEICSIENNMVTGLSIGQTTLTATYDGHTFICIIRVVEH